MNKATLKSLSFPTLKIPQNQEKPFLFEFMDLPWLPMSLRHTLTDALSIAMGSPFRPYYEYVAKRTQKCLTETNNNVIELGAGKAPIAQQMAKSSSFNGKIYLTDINPDLTHFENLEKRNRNLIVIKEPVNMATPPLNIFPEKCLLLYSACLHHLSLSQQEKLLLDLPKKGISVLIIEPLAPTLLSMFLAILVCIPTFLTPLFTLNKKSFGRNLFWCWLLPIAPILLTWDGIISLLRTKNASYWQKRLPTAQIKQNLSSLEIFLPGK